MLGLWKAGYYGTARCNGLFSGILLSALKRELLVVRKFCDIFLLLVSVIFNSKRKTSHQERRMSEIPGDIKNFEIILGKKLIFGLPEELIR